MSWLIFPFSTKKIFWSLLLLFSLSACDMELFLPTLKVPLTTSFNFSIDSSDLKSNLYILHEEVSSMDIDSLVTHYGGNPDLLSSVEILSVTLTANKPEGTDLSFLDSSYVSISSAALDETVVADFSELGSSGTEITYSITNEAANVIDYIADADAYTVRIYGEIAPPMPVKKVELLLEIEWEFLVNPF